MQDYIDQLDLPLKGKFEGDQKYEVEFTSSDMFERFYLIFSRYDFLTFDEDSSSLDLFGAELHWTDEENQFKITLTADYEKDQYNCVVEAA